MKLNPEQKQLLQRLSFATSEYWHWQDLWVFIDTESEGGAFQQYRGPEAHIDPDKTKGDRFGRALFSLREQFRKMAKDICWPRFEKTYNECLRAKIPEKIVDEYEKRGRQNKWNNPSMERLLAYFPRELPLREAKLALRDAIKNADSRASQREINILAKYLEALERKPREPYQTPKRIISWTRRPRQF